MQVAFAVSSAPVMGGDACADPYQDSAETDLDDVPEDDHLVTSSRA
ncbi:hypothetical protein [Nocardia sp. NPDC004711]